MLQDYDDRSMYVVILTLNAHNWMVMNRQIQAHKVQTHAHTMNTLTFLLLVRSSIELDQWDQIICEHESSVGEHPDGKVIVHVRFVVFRSYLELDLSTQAESFMGDYPQSIFLLVHHFGCTTLQLFYTHPATIKTFYGNVCLLKCHWNLHVWRNWFGNITEIGWNTADPCAQNMWLCFWRCAHQQLQPHLEVKNIL